MTLGLAILLVIILLLYDAIFLRMLLNRKRRTVFSLSIEDGKIKQTDGNVPDAFLIRAKELCELYQPGMIKVSATVEKEQLHLTYSGAITKELRDKFDEAFNCLS